MSEAPPSDFAYERLSVNSLLAGRYQLVRYVGEGAAGSVYLAQDLLLDNREVAVKVLHANLADHGPAVERLRREVEIAQSLSHPSIVQIYSFEPVLLGEDNRPSAMLVMEYVEGSTLREILQQGALARDEALALFNQLVNALAFIHERDIVHRDIKPENIIITKDGGVKLTDFGLAKHDTPGDLLTQSGQMMGTPGYMAPELYRGANASAASDVYSLGLVLYEMIYGEQLQQSERLIAHEHSREAIRIRRKLRWLEPNSGAVALILHECCAPDPAARPTSAVALKEQLAEGQRFSKRVQRYKLKRWMAEFGRSALRVTLVIVLATSLAALYFGRLVSPYSMAHLYAAGYLNFFQFNLSGGLLGLAPLDGTSYIREHASYGRPGLAGAHRLGIEGRRAMLICGIEHRLPEFSGRLPKNFDGIDVGMVESCASHPLQAKPSDTPPLVSPLAVVARIGDAALFKEILTKVRHERISQDAIEQTYMQAVRMNRADLIATLIEQGILPPQVSDQLLLEALMAPSEQIFEQLLASGVPFRLTLKYVTDRVARADNPNRSRWRKSVVARHPMVARRIERLLIRTPELREIGDKLTPTERIAIATKHPDLTSILIPLGVDWNVTGDDGMPLLLLAMTDRQNPAVTLLIAHSDVDLAVVSGIGMTPLAFAVGSHRPEWIRALQGRGVDMNSEIILRAEHAPMTPLRLVVPGNFIKTAKALLQDPRIDINKPLGPDDGLLIWSIFIPSTKMMELLLTHGADVAQLNADGRQPLHVAVSIASNRHVQLLLAHGAKVDARTSSGATPLMIAAKRAEDSERAAILRTLLDGGADPFARNAAGRTAFEFAVEVRHSQAIGELLDATRADPFDPLPSGKSVFELAQGSAAAVAEILERVNVTGLMELVSYKIHFALGYSEAIPTPRHELPSMDLAIRQRDLEAVQMLLARGAQPLTGESAATTIGLAIQLKDRAIIDALFARVSGKHAGLGAQLAPALRIAAQFGDLESVERLLALGADPEHRDHEGYIPVLSAYYSGKRAVVERLQRAVPDSESLAHELPLSRSELEDIFGVLE